MCQKPKKGMSKMIIEQNVQKCYILPFQCFIINFVTIFPSHVNFTHSNNISTKYELVSTLLARDNRKNVIFAILLSSRLARLFMNAFIHHLQGTLVNTIYFIIQFPGAEHPQ